MSNEEDYSDRMDEAEEEIRNSDNPVTEGLKQTLQIVDEVTSEEDEDE